LSSTVARELPTSLTASFTALADVPVGFVFYFVVLATRDTGTILRAASILAIWHIVLLCGVIAN
jgi:hypothetical protein